VWICIASYGGVSLLTGIICQALLEEEQKDHVKKQQAHEQRKKAFAQNLSSMLEELDVNHTGFVTKNMIKHVMGDRRSTVHSRLTVMGIDVSIDEMMSMVDKLDSGKQGIRLKVLGKAMDRMSGDATEMSVWEVSTDMLHLASETRAHLDKIRERANRIETRIDDIIQIAKSLPTVNL